MLSSEPSAVRRRASREAAARPLAEPLSTLLYRSRAVVAPSDAELYRIQQLAQARNRHESITGLLIYHDGQFFQWLEGPAAGLGRVWDAIRADPRHTTIELLGSASTPTRFYGDWDLKLSIQRLGEAGAVPAAAPALVSPVEALVRHLAAPLVQPLRPAAAQLIAGTPTGRASPRRFGARAPHLARLLTAADPAAAFDLLDRLHAQVGTIAALCATLFEPAARELGDLWQADECSEFEVTLGLWRLQTAMRRTDASALPAPAARMPSVLVTPQPGEPHMFGAALDAELLWRAGWDAQCEQPATDDALQRLLASTWFDALDLSLSAAFRREHWLPRMATSITLARRASRNPALVVVVGGRVFAEPSGEGAQVGADACSATALQLAPSILRLLHSRR